MSHLHGYEIRGEPIPPLLSPGPGPLGEIELEPDTEQRLLSAHGELTVLREDRAGAAFAVARTGGRFVVWGRGRGSFAADPARLRVRAAVAGDPAAFSHQLATVVIPLMLAERGAAALHASGVVTDRGAVLFAGGSGRGKSTTTVLASAHGHAPLADDAVVLLGDRGEPQRAFAGGAALWATPRAAAAASGETDAGLGDERRDRRIHTAPTEQPHGPVEIAAIVALAERGPQLSVRRLEPADALQRLVPALLHVGDRSALQRSFSALAAAVEAMPAWGVEMPEGLAAARDAVPQLLERVLPRQRRTPDG